MTAITAKGLKINGIVQGVGFRPFVFQLAKKFQIRGNVANTSEGVIVHAEGRPDTLDEFAKAIRANPPPLARITRFQIREIQVEGHDAFTIVSSEKGDASATLISPDMAICDDCRRELLDPNDRRFRYPFINCTNCGPRYTIISEIPYDRPNTSMHKFVMCPACQAEYDNPEDRRFHAQPNACALCGPRVSLHQKDGARIDVSDPVLETVRLLGEGHIIAVKGLGGFHLAVDAENEAAVRRLRHRKHREEKPFALMALDTAVVRSFAHVGCEEERLLTGRQRPIVLLRQRTGNTLAPSIAPGNRYFGVMLPYTPLHYLMFQPPCPFRILVMTSANRSEEPIVIDNSNAFERLDDIADYFLVHDRDIYLRSDDAIIRHAAGAVRPIRRSRGYVPTPVFLSRKVPSILACGAELKSTICLTRDDQAFVSQHIGDLENMETEAFFRRTIEHLKRILDIEPEFIAHDPHPDYLSTRYALTQDQHHIPKIAVQHHHAHIASCMAENREEGPVIGLALDGTGLGTDGTIWGGEVLLVEGADFTRAAHLDTVPMPGGATAIRSPWRMAVSHLERVFLDAMWDLDLPLWKSIDTEKARIVAMMAHRKTNAPLTSSLGRLFDAVAAMIGLRAEVSFEGQAAMELEMIADDASDSEYPFEWTASMPHRISTKGIIQGVVEDIEKGRSPARISARFHRTLIRMFTELCNQLKGETGIDRVALSGGVFQNIRLLEGVIRSLSREGFYVITHTEVPANDGGICLGQAWIVAAKLR